MEGREKGDLNNILNQALHISDFGFITNDDGEYPVLAILEYPDYFFFGNSVINDMLKEIEKDDMKTALADQKIIFKKLTSKKNGRQYFAFEFVE